MSGIGLIFNPLAGQNRRDPSVALRLARKLGDHGVVAIPRSLDELFRTAEDFLRLRIDVLGIAGGDGTNHVTLTGFHRIWRGRPLPPLALLRGGTMNTVASSLGLPRGQPERLLDRLLRHYTERPLELVSHTTMDIEGQLGFLFGTGIVPAFLRAYYATGEPSPWTATKTLARLTTNALVNGSLRDESIEAEVTTNVGDHWPLRRYSTIAAATIRDIGLGFRPFARAGEVPATFHLLGIHARPREIVADLPRIFRGEGMREGKANEALAREATIFVRQRMLPYMIDGDLKMHDGSELTVRLGPSVRIATMR